MRFEIFNEHTNEVWKKVASTPAINRLQLELDIYKKLLNFFQVGDYYYIIFNISLLGFEYVSPAAEKLLGYELSQINLTFFLELVHPDDRPWLLKYEEVTSGFLRSLPVEKLMKYKVRYDYRLKRKDGSYIRILHQSVIIEHDDSGLITRTLSVQTDISHFKKQGNPLLSYIGMDGEPSFLDIDGGINKMVSNEVLSPREKEVLLLLIEGKLSKQISDILGIKKNTVDNHRKNMLRKSNVNTSAELIAKSIRNGWL